MSAALPQATASLPLMRSLRGKGLLAGLVLLVYVAAASLYIYTERAEIMGAVESMEQLGQHEKALALTESAVNGAVVDVSATSNAAQAEPAPATEVALYMESCAKLFRELEPFDPSYALLQRSVSRSYTALQGAPLRANWIDLRETLVRVADELDIRHRRLAAQRDALNMGYQRQFHRVTLESLALALVGLGAFGALATWFLARLAGDVRRLEAHARAIVQGERGVSLSVERDDELGHLMHAVNRMSADLNEREKQIEVDTQRRSHDDKMLAVGALAAGIAHEVNNPLAIITGAAQALRSAPEGVTPETLGESAQVILAQAERAARAARQLADVAAPATADVDWLDINTLVRRVVQLTGYDRRYRQITIEPALDATLPALCISGHALQQVLMQMVSMACDALVASQQVPATLRVTTRSTLRDIEVELCLPPVLNLNRPEQQRAMLLCRAIIEPHRGRLAFGQAMDGLLRFNLTLPAEPGSEPG